MTTSMNGNSARSLLMPTVHRAPTEPPLAAAAPGPDPDERQRALLMRDVLKDLIERHLCSDTYSSGAKELAEGDVSFRGFAQLMVDEELDAETSLVRAILATNPALIDADIYDLHKTLREPRAVLYEGVLYAAVPDPNTNAQGEGGREPSGVDVMRLAVLKMAHVVDLDRLVAARLTSTPEHSHLRTDVERTAVQIVSALGLSMDEVIRRLVGRPPAQAETALNDAAEDEDLDDEASPDPGPARRPLTEADLDEDGLQVKDRLAAAAATLGLVLDRLVALQPERDRLAEGDDEEAIERFDLTTWGPVEAALRPAERRMFEALQKAGRVGIVVGTRLYAMTGGKAVGSQCDEYPQCTVTLELADVEGLPAAG
jgi:hypothetical protein